MGETMFVNRRFMLTGAAAACGGSMMQSSIGGALAQGLSAASAAKYEVVDVVEGGARFFGKLTYEGPEVCGQGTRSVQPLNVAEDGSLADAVIHIKGVTRGKAWDPVFEDAKIYQIDCGFQPFVQIVRDTASAEIFNFDPILHNIHAYEIYEGTRRSMFNFSQPKAGQVDFVPLRLRRGNLVSIDCNAHNWMAAWIYTSSSPYLSVTSVDGRFEITDIPPGDYEVSAWHPALGERTGNLTIDAGANLEFDVVLS